MSRVFLKPECVQPCHWCGKVCRSFRGVFRCGRFRRSWVWFAFLNAAIEKEPADG
jgi:hypothetical protein